MIRARLLYRVLTLPLPVPHRLVAWVLAACLALACAAFYWTLS